MYFQNAIWKFSMWQCWFNVILIQNLRFSIWLLLAKEKHHKEKENWSQKFLSSLSTLPPFWATHVLPNQQAEMTRGKYCVSLFPLSVKGVGQKCWFPWKALHNSNKSKISSTVGQSFWKSKIQVLTGLDKLLVLKL